jgi:Zn-dependent protease
VSASPARACAGCGTEMPPTFLACPSCGRLVHGEQLKALAAAAEAATAAGNTRAAIARWREALALLPPGSGQHTRIEATVKSLSASLDGPSPVSASGSAASPKKRGPLFGILAAVGAVLLKFKFAILFVLAKGKLLLTGLFQLKTMLSMVLAVGVYAMAYGWKFAVGLIASIYVHEMGHVERLRHYGIAATAPMFIPGFGAFVRLKQHPSSPREDASIGLAGPLWGAGAALAFFLVGRYGGFKLATAIAHVGAWINLFNLIPVWQLDGGRAFNALSRRQRVLTTILLWALAALLQLDGMMILLAIGATFRAATQKGPRPDAGDASTLIEYTSLVLFLVGLMVLAR